MGCKKPHQRLVGKRRGERGRGIEFQNELELVRQREDDQIFPLSRSGRGWPSLLDHFWKPLEGAAVRSDGSDYVFCALHSTWPELNSATMGWAPIHHTAKVLRAFGLTIAWPHGCGWWFPKCPIPKHLELGKKTSWGGGLWTASFAPPMIFFAIKKFRGWKHHTGHIGHTSKHSWRSWKDQHTSSSSPCDEQPSQKKVFAWGLQRNFSG